MRLILGGVAVEAVARGLNDGGLLIQVRCHINRVATLSSLHSCRSTRMSPPVL